MITDPIDDDIRDVMAEETSRGRRPHDAEAAKLRKKRLEDFRMALALKTEQDFVKAIRELGYASEPHEVAAAVRVWRSLSSSRP